MSEERTQTPSRLRRQQARERGQVAQSAELTGAVGMLAAAALLGIWGDGLAAALIAMVREPLLGAPIVSADPVEVVSRLRHVALVVAWPLGIVIGAVAVAAVAAHQAQVGGLWVPGRLAPDPARLWSEGQGWGFAARAARGVWALIKTAIVVAVAAWMIRSDWPGFLRLGALGPQALAHAAGHALRHLSLTLAVALLALGLIDFALQHQRFEALLRLTPEEQREDLRAVEGDPALRARRRRIAQGWRGGPGENLAGASLVLTGAAGLTVVLAGGPPPRRVTILALAQGVSGLRLRRGADSAGLPQAPAPDLARRLAERRILPLPAEVVTELGSLWPSASVSPPR